jgi:ABC-type phosphate transport system substrate-binding protein
MKRCRIFCSTLSFILLAVVPARPADALFKVIVNPSVVGRTIQRDLLAKIYLGDLARWGNGDPISAVDLSTTSAVRHSFSERVVGMTTDAVMHHWLRRMTGATRVLPPKTKATDEAVIAYVAGQAGSVGYVSTTAALPDTVREIIVE